MSQVPCLLPGQHRGELLHSCRVCASELIRLVRVADPDACRLHAGQLAGTCGPCSGERHNPSPEPAGPTPVRRRRSGICEHGLKIRRRGDGTLACQHCRRAGQVNEQINGQSR